MRTNEIARKVTKMHEPESRVASSVRTYTGAKHTQNKSLQLLVVQ